MRGINRRKFLYVTGLGAFLCGIGYLIINSPIMKSMLSKSDDLPPGQYETDHILKWNIEHPGIIPENPKINLEDWKLTVEGKVENPTSFTWKDFLEILAIDTINDFHCVERWSVRNCKWYGVRFKTFVDTVKPTKDASYVIFYCSDGYTTSLNLDDLLKENVILAYKLNDEFLEESLGGPMRLIFPDKYGYKSAMWVERMKFTAIKEFGYWEKLGYNDSADVWKERDLQNKKRLCLSGKTLFLRTIFLFYEYIFLLMLMPAKFEVFKDASGQFRFRLVAPNGEIIAASEAYTAKDACMNGIESVKTNAPDAEIEDQTA